MEFNFESIIETLQERLSLQTSWKRSLFYAVYSYIVRAIAYVLERYAYQGEIYQSESNWFSSSIREFLVKQAFYLSYTPTRNVSPFGQVWISFDELELTNAKITDIQKDTPILSHSQYTGNNIIFKKWTQILGEGNVSGFVSEDTTYFQNTIGSISVPVKIGTPITYRYIASGISNEQIILAQNNIDNNELEINIVDSNGTIIFPVTILNKGDLNFIQENTDGFYAESYNSDNFQSVVLKFGDGVINKKLSPNDVLLIKYASTNGTFDDITNTNVINSFANSITDITGKEVEIFVTNNEEISDGKNIEDIESIRLNAPQLFNTGYRLGSDPDWETILTNEPIIQKAIVWNVEDLGLSSLGTTNDLVYGTAVSLDGTALTTIQQEDIFTRVIKENKSVTERFQWDELEEIFAVFKINATVSNQTESVLKGLINTELINNYGILNVPFNTNIYSSNFINVIDDIVYVLHHTTELYHMEKNLSQNVTNYQIKTIDSTPAEAVDKIILVSNETGIYIRRKIDDIWETPILVGLDVSGTLTGQNGFTISGSSINYDTGVISFIIDEIVGSPSTYGVLNPTDEEELGFIVTIQYKTRDGNSNFTNDMRLKEFYQITNTDINFNEFEFNYQ